MSPTTTKTAVAAHMDEQALAMGKLLTVEQVLRIVPISRSTLWRMENQGKFPEGRFISGNRKVWRFADVKEWQDQLPTVTRPRRRRRVAK